MSITWAVNPETGDLFINGSGTLQTVFGEQEVKQRILIALRHMYGEYFLDIPGGIPWYSGVTANGQSFIGLLGTKNQSLVETIIRMTILNVPNVLSIASLQITQNAKRNWSLAAQIEVQGQNGPSIISIVTEIGSVTPQELLTTSTGVEVTTETGIPIVLG
jgi:hypothetical protein